MHTAMSAREKRHRRIRKRISGTPERPRLCVFRSQKHLYAQLIDDVVGRTICSVSTRDARLLQPKISSATVQAAAQLGQLVAETARSKKIQRVVFDRGGYQYHGRVRALAESARANGLEF